MTPRINIIDDIKAAVSQRANRLDRLELLLQSLIAWQSNPSNVLWQPVQKLIKELSEDGTTDNNREASVTKARE